MFTVPYGQHIALAARVFALFNADSLKEGFPEAHIGVKAVFGSFHVGEFFMCHGSQKVVAVSRMYDGKHPCLVYDHPVF